MLILSVAELTGAGQTNSVIVGVVAGIIFCAVVALYVDAIRGDLGAGLLFGVIFGVVAGLLVGASYQDGINLWLLLTGAAVAGLVMGVLCCLFE